MSHARIPGSRSVPKCHGSATLLTRTGSWLHLLKKLKFWIADRIRIPLFTLMRIRIRLFILKGIRILLLNKAMRICNHWSPDSSRLHFDPPRLYSERPWPSMAPSLKFLNFYFSADSDPAFHSNADPIQLPSLSVVLHFYFSLFVQKLPRKCFPFNLSCFFIFLLFIL